MTKVAQHFVPSNEQNLVLWGSKHSISSALISGSRRTLLRHVTENSPTTMRNSLKRTCVYYLYCRERRADSVACEVDLKLHSPTGANTLISSQAKPSATHSSETNRMTIKRHPPQEQAYWPSSMILLRNKQSDSRAPSSTETIAFWQPRVILTEQTKMSNKRNPSG